jgi:hypothetical protein
MGIPQYFINKTDKFSAVFFKDGFKYYAAGGKYPNTFIKNRLGNDKQWQEESYKKIDYYFSKNNEILIIPLRNIILLAQSSTDDYTSNAEKIIDAITSMEAVAVDVPENSVFHLDAKDAVSLCNSFAAYSSIFSAFGGNLENFSGIKCDLLFNYNSALSKEKSGKEIPVETSSVLFSFNTGSEKNALVFSAMFRMLLSDYFTKHGIMDLKKIKDFTSVKTDGAAIVTSFNLPFDNMENFLKNFLLNKGD